MKETLSDDEITHPLNEQLLDEAERVKTERRTLKERMDKLDETRPSVSEAVYNRVKSDYNAKLQQTTDRMLALRRSLETEEKKLLEKKLLVEANIRLHKEKIEESALRHSLGEFGSADHEALMTAEAQEIARLEVALAHLSEGLGRHRQIFEGEELPQPAAARPAPPPPRPSAPPPPPARPAADSRRESGLAGSRSGGSGGAGGPPDFEDDFESEPTMPPPPMRAGDHTAKIRLEGHTDQTVLDDEPPEISVSSRGAAERPRHASELLVMENGKVIQTLSLDRTIQIGRSPSNDVVLKEPKVSRKHAEIQYIGGKYIILDLESSNGTYVGGKRVSEQVLQPNDEIVIGNTKMVFKG